MKQSANRKIISLIISVILTITIVVIAQSYYSNNPEKVEGLLSPKNNIDILELEEEIHTLVNVERTSRGLYHLTRDDELREIARNHSQDMANRDFFDHLNPEGDGATERGLAAGYECKKDYGSHYTEGLGENLAQTPIHYNVEGCGKTNSLESLAKCIVDGWMDSPGHRENILTGEYSRAGVGVAYDEGIYSYATQVFC